MQLHHCHTCLSTSDCSRRIITSISGKHPGSSENRAVCVSDGTVRPSPFGWNQILRSHRSVTFSQQQVERTRSLKSIPRSSRLQHSRASTTFKPRSTLRYDETISRPPMLLYRAISFPHLASSSSADARVARWHRRSHWRCGGEPSGVREARSSEGRSDQNGCREGQRGIEGGRRSVRRKQTMSGILRLRKNREEIISFVKDNLIFFIRTNHCTIRLIHSK